MGKTTRRNKDVSNRQVNVDFRLNSIIVVVMRNTYTIRLTIDKDHTKPYGSK